MPIFWILVVGVLFYLALQQMEKQYSLKNKMPSAPTPSTVETDAVALPVETELSPEESTAGTPFVDTIPGLSKETKQALQQLNLTTSRSISDTSDKKLLAIKGIGPARLKQIRSLCADAKNQESEIVDQATD